MASALLLRIVPSRFRLMDLLLQFVSSDLEYSIYVLYTTFSCDDSVDLSTTISRIETCLVDITNWMTTNKLKLNNDKTELLIVYSRFRHSPRLPYIKIRTDIIKPTNKARYVGVIFDNTVTMSFHIYNIVKGAYYHLRNITKIRKYISMFQRLKFLWKHS